MEETRAAGPSVVWAGPSGAPAVVVLDPAGVGRHGELPGSWRPLTEHLQVMWCRLPAADEPWQEVDEVLSEFAGRSVGVHVVAGAAAGSDVGELVHRHEDVIRSVQTFAAPIPLGHPEVVLEVVRELLEDSSLLGESASGVRESVVEVFEKLRRE